MQIHFLTHVRNFGGLGEEGGEGKNRFSLDLSLCHLPSAVPTLAWVPGAQPSGHLCPGLWAQGTGREDTALHLNPSLEQTVALQWVLSLLDMRWERDLLHTG